MHTKNIDMLNPAEPTNGRRPHCTDNDLEQLFELAEWLADKCENYRARFTWLMHYATGLGGAVISAAVLVWTFMDPDSPLRMPLTGTILGSAGAVASVSFVYWLHIRRLRVADQRALDETFALLRSIAADTSTWQGLSTTAQAAYRIRLTRLGADLGREEPRPVPSVRTPQEEGV